MIFTVKYRAKDGSVAEECIEAASRGECIAKCKAHGIAPVSVREGNGRIQYPQKGCPICLNCPNRKSLVAKLFLTAVVTTTIVAAIWWCFADDEAPVPVLEKSITVQKTKKAVKSVVPVAKPIQPIKVVIEDDKPPKGYVRLPIGKDIRCKLPPTGETKQLLAFGEMYEIDSAGNVKSLSPPPIFDNRFENTMMALSAEGMGMMPGAAEMIPKDEVVSYLMKSIEIKDDDSEDVIAKMIATAEMKEALKEFLKSGGTWEEFVAQARTIQQTEQMLESEARMEMAKMLRNGDIEFAKEFKNKVNSFMKSKGYRGLKLPSKWKELIGE